MSFYSDMAAVAAELLAPESQGGLGQGSIVLVRYTPAAAGANPWDAPGAPTPTRTTLAGVVSGVSKELVGTPVADGTAIVATDLQVIVAPWGGSYDPGDVLELDGTPVIVLKVQNIPAVGTVAAVKFIARR